jgi:hypothetical protein
MEDQHWAFSLTVFHAVEYVFAPWEWGGCSSSREAGLCGPANGSQKNGSQKKIEGAQLSLTVAPGRWVHEKC